MFVSLSRAAIGVRLYAPAICRKHLFWIPFSGLIWLLKGNIITQKYYLKNVLIHHIKHIKWLKIKYNRKFWFQENNNPSYKTHSKNNVVAQTKMASHLQLLNHCAQSPD